MTATTKETRQSLETLAVRFLELADKQAAEEAGRDQREIVASSVTVQWPGEPALRRGRYRLLNIFGAATGEVMFVAQGHLLPDAPRGFTWQREDVPFAFFRPAFEATPHPYLLLTPELKIAGANDAYLTATLTRRSDLLGCYVFDAFPDNPDDPEADGVANLSASLAHVLEHTCAHKMERQRYDIRGPEGRFLERWWQPVNIPVFGGEGRLLHIIHCVEDVTNQNRGGHTG